MNKRGISDVITTVLIILISIAAILVVWQVLKPSLQQSASGINLEAVNVNLQMEKSSIKINQTSGVAEVKIILESGDSQISQIKFVLSNGSDDYIYTANVTLKLLEERLFVIPFGNLINVTSIKIYPVIITSSGTLIATVVSDVYIITGNEPVSSKIYSVCQEYSSCSFPSSRCLLGTNMTQYCYYNSSNSCTYWVNNVSCIGGQVCDGVNCITPSPTCTSDCSNEGQMSCNGNIVQNCTRLGSCLKLVNITTCSLGESCGQGVCGLWISSCLASLNQVGKNYYLANDLDFSSADANVNPECLSILADNVTLDCLGRKIINDNYTMAIAVYNRSSSIRNCNVVAGSQKMGGTGFYFSYADGVNVLNCTADHQGYGYGYDLEYTNLGSFSGISSTFNGFSGMNLYYSSGNSFSGITSRSNTASGLYFVYSSGNSFSGITSSSNTASGLYLRYSHGNKFSSANLNNNSQYGAYLYLISQNNTFTSVTSNYNNKTGFFLSGPNVLNNTFSSVTSNYNNQYGFAFVSSKNNSVISSNINYNNYYGLYISNGLSNKFTNNRICYNNNTVRDINCINSESSFGSGNAFGTRLNCTLLDNGKQAC